MAKLQLRVFTTENAAIDEPVSMVIVRCIAAEEGTALSDIGILPNHAPCAAVLGPAESTLRIINDEDERQLQVYGGAVTVQDNVVTVLTQRAKWVE